MAPTLQNMLRGRKVMSEIYVRRIPLSEVPDDDEGASNYLHELYRQKVCSPASLPGVIILCAAPCLSGCVFINIIIFNHLDSPTMPCQFNGPFAFFFVCPWPVSLLCKNEC